MRACKVGVGVAGNRFWGSVNVFVLLSVLLLGTLAALPSASAQSVRLSVGLYKGYGRMVFRWHQPVGYQTILKNGRLVVRFSRPINVDLSPALKGLSPYIAAIEPAPDKSSVAFRLKGNFKVLSYDSAATVVIDLMNPSATALLKGQPGDPRVRVRVGAHKGYSRIVFEWPNVPKYKLKRIGDKATIVFNARARMDLSRLKAGRLRYVGGAQGLIRNARFQVALTIDPASRTRIFTSGSKVVMDIFAPANKPPVKKPPVKKPGTRTDLTPLKAGTKITKNQKNEPPAPRPLPLVPVTPTPLQGAAKAAQPATAQEPAAVEQRLVPKVTALPNGVVAVRFDWKEPVGAAVFRRGGALWVVFDKRTQVEMGAIVRGGAGLISEAKQEPSRAGTVLRFKTAKGINPDIKRSGLSWILEFLKQPLLPGAPLQVDAQPKSPFGARLFISVPAPGNIIAFRDPEIGNNLLVVPVIPLGSGFARPWTFPQVKILASKQGIAIEPLIDTLRVRSLRQGVEISAKGIFQVSGVTAEEKAKIALSAALAVGAGVDSMRPLSRILDLEKWKRADLQDFVKISQKLERNISKTKTKPEKEKARRDLALFYFSNGFWSEALGVLQVMGEDRPAIKKSPEFRLVLGVTNLMMERFSDARANLFDAVLDGKDETTFWRAALEAKEGHMAKAAYDLRKTGAITQTYPKAIKVPATMLVADAAIELGDVKQATKYLEVLSIDKPTAAEKDQIDYERGKLKSLSGDPNGAIAQWEKAMAGVDRPSRVKSAIARTELLLKEKKFTPGDAIEEFEKLRFVWRGDALEFNLLRRLGDLYLQDKKFRKGLSTLRQAATYFPKEEGVNKITKKMSDVFQNLFLKGGADVLPPVSAIALYDEFRELTPPGKLGDEMIRKLADRLVGVDLLSRAADILESQVDFRLKGEQKARVGARLALIDLMDNKFERALKALQKTDGLPMSDTLATRRVLLRAQANIGLKKPKQALALLNSEISLEAEQMRAGIYWRAADWKNAAKSMRRVVRDLGVKPNKPLNDTQSAAVLAVAVAYTLSGNDTAIMRLATSYGKAMALSAYADGFSLMTDLPGRGLMNYRNLDAIVKRVVKFQGFMESYRARAAAGKLSSLY